MKKLGVLIVLSLFVLASSCYSYDDDFNGGRSVFLQINDAITIDNQENYVVGDTIVFELNFSRLLAEEGFANPLDIYETTNAEVFGFRFEIEKFSEFSNRFEFVFVDEQFILASRVNDDDFNFPSGQLAAVLDDSRQSYSATVAVILPEAGRFNLALEGIRIESPYSYESPGQIQVSIVHRFSSENAVNTEFEVIGE